jgi:hypothetical protein
MCPISLPFCMPYWVYILLICLGLTSKTAFMIVAPLAVFVIGYSGYKLYQRYKTNRGK